MLRDDGRSQAPITGRICAPTDTTTDEMGREVPISTSYEVLMHLDDPDNVLTPGMRGTARIVVGSRTVGQWLWRLFWQTFNFRM